MFVIIRELAVVSIIAAIATLPMAINASADTAKPVKIETVSIDKSITDGIAHHSEYLSKNKKFAFGKGTVPYSGPQEAFYINGIN